MSSYSHELPLPDAKICARYAIGESAYRLGRAYGVTTDTILRRLRNNDIEIRHHGSPICQILRAHKAALKDDPERMSGEFIVEMSRKVDRAER